MSGLNQSLAIALTGLATSQQALATSTNNVANANTPGYSRERVVLAAGEPVLWGPFTYGTGVVLQKVESVRDSIIEIQLNQETQQQSKLDAALGQLLQVQSQFGTGSTGIGADITNFFNALQQLAPEPSSLALRQSVLTAAGNLANDFNTTANHLQTQRSNLDLTVIQSVSEVNTLTAQIAGIDAQIAYLQNVHQDASTLIDKQTNLIRQLSGLVDVTVIPTDNGGITLATTNGTTLVAGSKSFALSTQLGSDGLQHVMAGADDITGALKGGKLAGLIQIRDQEIPNLQGSLDQLAAGVATALNTANRAGFDLNGVAGVDLFVPPPVGGAGTAATLSLNITDPALIAASSDGAPGSNGNLAVLAAVHDQAVAGGQTPLDYYSNIVFHLDNITANTSADVDASNLILKQLQDQRGSISGVSLDEEAANIVQYQTSYQAAARVVSTVSSLLDVAVNLGRY